MSKVPHEEGYIYIYKCIVGNSSNFCKIGVTDNLKTRMAQHVRTPYQGFICFLDFLTCKPIVTAFKVADMNVSDKLVTDYFIEYQLGKLEVYDIDYNVAIQELYTLLSKNKQFISLIEDKITKYDFLKLDDEVTIDTSKAVFEKIRDQILSKYNNELPEELIELLRDEKEFEVHCSSHYKTGNFIHFYNGLVLDIHFSKSGRALILNKLKNFL